MPTSNILLYLDNKINSEKYLEYAVNIANQYDSDLCGLHLETIDFLANTKNIINSLSKEESSALYFHRRTEKLGLKGNFVITQAKGSLNDALSLYSHSQDLIILGQTIDNVDLIDTLFSTASVAAVNCACPVLVLSEQQKTSLFCSRPLFIWDGSIESSRTLRKALFLLDTAEEIDILIEETRSLSKEHLDQSTQAMLQYLQRNNLAPNIVNHNFSANNRSQALIEYIKDNLNDLVIMRAYDHSRLYQLMNRDMTREILRQSPAPVFLSH